MIFMADYSPCGNALAHISQITGLACTFTSKIFVEAFARADEEGFILLYCFTKQPSAHPKFAGYKKRVSVTIIICNSNQFNYFAAYATMNNKSARNLHAVKRWAFSMGHPVV